MLKKYTTVVTAFCSRMVSTSVVQNYSLQQEAILKRGILAAANLNLTVYRVFLSLSARIIFQYTSRETSGCQERL